MRIIIHDYAGHSFPIELSRELAKRGHEVLHAFAANLLTPRGALTRRLDDPVGLEFYEVPMNSHYRRDKYSFVRRRSYEIAYGSLLTTLVDQWHPDVVLSGQTPTEPQRKFQRHCKRNGIRFINWIQDIYSVAVTKLAREKLPLIGGAVGAYYSHLDQACARQSDHNIVITDDFTPILSEWKVAQNRVTTISNWAAIDAIPVKNRDNSWAQQQGLTKKFTFLYSGTLAMKHNPELILKLAQFFQKEQDVAVVVVSEGPGADWLQLEKDKHNLSNLKILPFQPFGDFPEVLASADVLLAVLETDAGTFSVPSKVLSYLCAGRPLLTAMPANNLAAQLVTSIPAGLSTPPHHSELYLEHASKLYADPECRQQYATGARRYAEENFRIASLTDRFEKILTGQPGGFEQL